MHIAHEAIINFLLRLNKERRIHSVCCIYSWGSELLPLFFPVLGLPRPRGSPRNFLFLDKRSYVGMLAHTTLAL